MVWNSDSRLGVSYPTDRPGADDAGAHRYWDAIQPWPHPDGLQQRRHGDDRQRTLRRKQGGRVARSRRSVLRRDVLARDPPESRLRFRRTVNDVGASVSDRGGDGDLNLAGVKFEVREWFTGGDADEVTIDLQSLGEGTAEEDLPFQVGPRLLVSGEPRWGGAPLDSLIAWDCGSSRYFDEETAAVWRESATA